MERCKNRLLPMPLLALAVSCWMIACGGAGTGVTTLSGGSAVSVALTPAGPATLNTSGSGIFTATVTGAANTAVTWSVDGIAGGNAAVGTLRTGTPMAGSLGNLALYTAPSRVGIHTVTAVSSAEPSSSTSVQVTVAAAAYTATNPGNTFDVTGYGAAGDGARDNGGAFANAIAAASASGGGVVVVPAAARAYEIACNRTGFGYYGILLPDNVTLQINAGATVQAMAGAPSPCCLVGVDGSNVNITGGGTLDGNLGPNPAGTELLLVSLGLGSNITVAGVTLQNSPEDGLYIEQSLGGTLSGVRVYGVTASGNYRDGLTIDSGTDIVVRDSTIADSTACGIDIEPNNGEHPANISIYNCQLTGNGLGGIQSGPVNSGDTGTFANALFAFNTIAGNHGFGIYQGNSTGIAILDNTITGTLADSASGYPGIGIMLDDLGSMVGVTDDLVSGNIITGSAGSGIYCVLCRSTSIAYNTITGSGGYGIENADGSATVVNGTNEGSANARGNTNGGSF